MQITANDPIWTQPIQTIPLIQAFPELGQVEEFNEKQVVLTEDHKRLFSVISAKAVVKHHKEAIDIVGQALEHAYNSEPKVNIKTFKQGAQMKAKFTMPDEPIIDLGGGDESSLHVLLYNSYDKALPFKVRVGAYRFICDNGMVIGDDIAQIQGRDLLENWSPEGVAKNIQNMMEQAKAVTDMWKSWRRIEVPFEVAVDACARRLPGPMLKKLDILESSFPMSMWDLYNHFTAIVTHESKSDRAQHTFDNVISTIFYKPKSPMFQHYQNVINPKEVA